MIFSFFFNKIKLILYTVVPEISKIYITRLPEEQIVEFSGLFDEKGEEKKIRCSNVEIRLLLD